MGRTFRQCEAVANFEEGVMTCPCCLDAGATIKEASEGSTVDVSTVDLWNVTCPKCGNYRLDGITRNQAESGSVFCKEDRLWLPHTLRRMQVGDSIPTLSTADLVALKNGLVR